MSAIPIIGAGLSGLIAGVMINDPVKIYEKQASLPNNHHAVLRFRSTALADATNIQFKKVRVIRCVHPWKNAAADALVYSYKCTGAYTSNRSLSAVSPEPVVRYISPPDLIQQLHDRIGEDAFEFSQGFSFEQIMMERAKKQSIISTIPMPVLMKILEYPHPHIQFCNREAMHLSSEIMAPADAYISIYDPDPESPITRLSITGKQVYVESHSLEVIPEAIIKRMGELGCCMVTKQWEMNHSTYAKILPIDEQERRKFIRWATEEHGIYSLGRFATWRQGLLLDDIVQDVRLITRMMRGEQGPKYKV